jgi:hypothetical protein
MITESLKKEDVYEFDRLLRHIQGLERQIVHFTPEVGRTMTTKELEHLKSLSQKQSALHSRRLQLLTIR